MTPAATTGSLERLQELDSTGYGDSFVDGALRKIIDRQIARNQADPVRINDQMSLRPA